MEYDLRDMEVEGYATDMTVLVMTSPEDAAMAQQALQTAGTRPSWLGNTPRTRRLDEHLIVLEGAEHTPDPVVRQSMAAVIGGHR